MGGNNFMLLDGNPSGNYFFEDSIPIEDALWSEEYSKKDGVDGVNADIKKRYERDDLVSVSRVIEGFDGVSHVVSGLRCSLDVGEGEDVGVMSVYDVERGEYTFGAEVKDVDDNFLNMMGIECPKRFEDDFEVFAKEVMRGYSDVLFGRKEEYTTPRCDMLVEADDKSELYRNVRATFKRK